MVTQDNTKYIDAIHDCSVEVHGTVDATDTLINVPSYVINHGVLPGDELQELLRKTKVGWSFLIGFTRFWSQVR